MKNVILFGSTGMIGQELKNELLKQNIFLYLPVRNTFQQETKTQQIQYLDFQDYKYIDFNIDAVYITLGTTLKQAKTKGQMEQDILKLNLKYIHIYRPSLLKVSRKEFRLNEFISIPHLRFISFFGTKMKKYKPVTPKQVAFYMAQNLGNHKHKINIHESDSINNNKGNT